jgi:hypothetical protein
MADTLVRTDSSEEEALLIERLVERQGVTYAEAASLVDEHKRGGRAEIDPALLIGLETL